MIQEMLFNLSGKTQLIPELATGYHVSKNGLTYKISLRHGVKWSDGVPVTSKDAVFTLTKVLPVDPVFSTTLKGAITSVTADGPYALTIKLKEPFSPLLTALSASVLFVEPAHQYGSQTPVKDTYANNHPLSDGPFMLKKWIPDDKLILVRNPHFWQATKAKPVPWFNKVVVDVITSPQTVVDDMLSGAVDYVPTSFLPTPAIKTLAHAACCRVVHIHDQPSYNIMYMNTTRPPFNNVTVRRAVLMAITRALIVKDADTGHARPAKANIPATFSKLYTPEVNLLKEYPYSPSKAAKLLDKAGFPVRNGERFGKAITLLYSTFTGTFANREASIIKAQLAKVTINVHLVSEDAQAELTDMFVKKNYTLSFINSLSGSDPAQGIVIDFQCEPNPTPVYTNATGFCTRHVTSLFHHAAVATSTASRQHFYAKAQKILDRMVPAVMLYWRETYVAISKRIENWKPSLLTTGGSFWTTWSQSWLK